MVRPQQGVPSNDWLAVLDGRFLPVDELELLVERNTQDVVSATGMQPSTTVTTAEIISGTIETRREPAVRRSSSQLRLYGPKEEYFIWNIILELSVPPVSVETYAVEFEATDWECRKR